MKIAANLVCSAALCVATSTAPPASAQQSPDVLGFRLGMTYPEVKARIAELKLQVAHDGVVEIKGLSGSSFRPLVDANDVGPKGLGPSGSLSFSFSAPPSESRLIGVTRTVNYDRSAVVGQQNPLKGTASSGAATNAALVQKFGKPTASNPELGRMRWIWAPNGNLLSRDPGTPCQSLAGDFLPRAPARGIFDHQKRVIDAGCGTFVEVNVTVDSAGVVTNIDQMAVDVAGGDRAKRLTANAMRDSAAKQDGEGQERATKQKPSI